MEIKKELIGLCGVYCGACRLYITQKCKGCVDPSTVECAIYRCVRERGINVCGACLEFPCKTHYSKDSAVYSKNYLDWKRKELNRG